MFISMNNLTKFQSEVLPNFLITVIERFDQRLEIPVLRSHEVTRSHLVCRAKNYHTLMYIYARMGAYLRVRTMVERTIDIE